MPGIKDYIGNRIIQRMINKTMGTGLMQEENSATGEKYITEGMPQLVRKAAAEGCVLLENDGTLPLHPNKEVAVFGRCQLDWFYVGYGSGGDVSAPYYVNFIEAMDNAGIPYNQELFSVYREWCESSEHKADHGWWGHWPMSHPEMPVSAELVKKAADKNDTALVIIGRAAGEDRENLLEKGSYYLTDAETALLDRVTSAFQHTVVIMDIGNIIDFSWTKKYEGKLSALLIAFLGGMESGNAVCDILYGNSCPSGKLSDTIAVNYEDYPSSSHFGGLQFNEYAEDIFVGYRHFEKYAKDKILYPFGYGLSYTQFQIKPLIFVQDKDTFRITLQIKNTGVFAGKEVVKLWCNLPQTGLVKPVRVLAGFAKTPELKPDETCDVTILCKESIFESYEEAGHAFILDEGNYSFYANDCLCGEFTIDNKRIVEQCEEAMTASVNLKQRITERLPEEIKTPEKVCTDFNEVLSGNADLDAFIAGLSDRELEALTRGQGMMNSAFGVSGNAGAFGGIISSLREKGVPAVITSDGPSGLRLNRYASLLPCGTALACSWNTELTESLYSLIAKEMQHYEVDILLAPGMNIHRNPLCGRNFEYYSEDPVLSGKTAAAAVRGIQSLGAAACPKHFSCNNQEIKRNTNDSRVSERALREIYLKNFEICVKESQPLTIMSSYNKVNGVWSHYNYDLATTILRKQWGYQGVVITDWWMQKSASPEFPKLKDNAYRVRAQVDVLMPGDMGHMAKKYRSDGTLLPTLGKHEGITKAELQRTARNVLNLILKLKSLDR